MTNLKGGPDHNMLSLQVHRFSASQRHVCGAISRGEAGYTLVALLALMTVLALFAAAAAPNIRQQAQRDREVEAIYRGEQMAEGIRVYYSYQQRRLGNGEAALPTSIDTLLEGVPSGTKKVQVIRPSAARDPLSTDGEWRLIRPRSSALSDFQQSLMLYIENIRPTTNDPQLKQIEQLMAPPVLPTLGIATSRSSSVDEDSSSGAFIGVASKSTNASVINYYGIDHHNEWVFTPLFR